VEAALKLARFPLLVSSLVLAAATLDAAQQRRAFPAGAGDARGAFAQPRFLHDLQHGGTNLGVRLAADVDADGDTDLVLLRSDNNGAQIWHNGGQAHFQLVQQLAFYSVNARPDLADVTGDGVLDLVSNRPNNAIVFPGLGDGTFGAMVVIDPGGAVSSVVVGDCDADGDADVLVTYFVSPERRMAWWRHQAGSFVPGPSLVLGESLRQTTPHDLDDDGDADVVAMNLTADALHFFRTVAGVTTFDAALALPTEMRNVNARIRTGDLEGDGDVDLLMTLMGSQASLFFPLLRSGAALQAGAVQSVTHPFNSMAEGALADWDEDGDLDYVTGRFSWLENDGAAHFTLVAREYDGGGEAVAADLDGDGRLDVLSGWSLYFGDGEMPGASTVSALDPVFNPLWTAIEDWEGDGDPDLVSADRLYLNRGDGSFEIRTTPHGGSAGETIERVAWADFDGDGFRDALVAVFETRPYPQVEPFLEMRVYSGDSRGQYHASPAAPSASQIVGPGVGGDVDGDGDVDLLTEGMLWTNAGDGSFTLAPGAPPAGVPLRAVDVDADGDVDVLAQPAGQLVLWRNAGALVFQLESFGAYGDRARPVLLDADEDGDLDLVVTEWFEDGLWVHEQLASGSFAPRLGLELPEASNGPAGQVDVNGDGRLDLVCNRAQLLLSAWIRGDGLDFVERREWWLRDYAFGFADFDGDGDVDVAGRSRVENVLYHGATAGKRVQYALDCASSGTGDIAPVLGARGPMRAGSGAELVVARGLGGAAGVVSFGRRRSAPLACWPPVFVQPTTQLTAFVLDGAPGAPGAGSLRAALPADLWAVGRTFTFQALIFDAGGTSGLAATNALELTLGDALPRRTR
jgi:hypothetical protein